MTGTLEQTRQIEICYQVATKPFLGVRYVVEIIGGPDRDRTDDLFHAMMGIEPQIIDGTALTNRHNRQKRAQWGTICGQNAGKISPGGQGADRVESAQFSFPCPIRLHSCRPGAELFCPALL